MPTTRLSEERDRLEVQHAEGWVPAAYPLRDPAGLNVRLVDEQQAVLSQIERQYKWGNPARLNNGAAVLGYIDGSWGGSGTHSLSSNTLLTILVVFFSANNQRGAIRTILYRTSPDESPANAIVQRHDVFTSFRSSAYASLRPAAEPIVVPTYGCPRLRIEADDAGEYWRSTYSVYGFTVSAPSS